MVESVVGPHVAVSLPSAGSTAADGGAAAVLDAACRAEEFGFDAVMVGDHVLHPLPMLESLVTLAAVAGHTRRVGLEVAVLQLAMRQLPIAVKQIATLASFAPGRLCVGIGVGGEHPDEWAANDVPLAGRGQRTTLATETLRTALRGGTVGFDRIAPRRLDPVPTARVPLFLGGRNRAALYRAATLGDGWVGWLHSPDGVAGIRAHIEGERRRAGLTNPFWFGIMLPVVVLRPGAAVQDVRYPTGSGRYRIVGDAATVVEQLRRYWDAGADRLKLSIVDADSSAAQLEILGRDVLPQLREWRR